MLSIRADEIKIEFKGASHQMIPLSLGPPFKQCLTFLGHHGDPILVDHTDQSVDDPTVRF